MAVTRQHKAAGTKVNWKQTTTPTAIKKHAFQAFDWIHLENPVDFFVITAERSMRYRDASIPTTAGTFTGEINTDTDLLLQKVLQGQMKA